MLLAHADVRVLVNVALPSRGRVDPKRPPKERRAVVDRLVALGVAKERFDTRRAATTTQRANQLELLVSDVSPR